MNKNDKMQMMKEALLKYNPSGEYIDTMFLKRMYKDLDKDKFLYNTNIDTLKKIEWSNNDYYLLDISKRFNFELNVTKKNSVYEICIYEDGEEAYEEVLYRVKQVTLELLSVYNVTLTQYTESSYTSALGIKTYEVSISSDYTKESYNKKMCFITYGSDLELYINLYYIMVNKLTFEESLK